MWPEAFKKRKKERKLKRRTLNSGPLGFYLVLIPIWKEAGPGSWLGPEPGWEAEGRSGSIQGGSPRGGGGELALVWFSGPGESGNPQMSSIPAAKGQGSWHHL